jgi:hypothetical protein
MMLDIISAIIIALIGIACRIGYHRGRCAESARRDNAIAQLAAHPDRAPDGTPLKIIYKFGTRSHRRF